ncbi:solute carrier organic anion transporter family member 4A1-like [Saccoglossus kowalevskii]
MADNNFHSLGASASQKDTNKNDYDAENKDNVQLGVIDTEPLTVDQQCGWGSWKPSCAQVFNNSKGVLFFLCIFSITQSMAVNGFINVVITSLERRFDLPSINTGLIASSYDIAVLVLLIFVTYYGGQGHKPKMLGCGAFIVGLGSFVFMLPHFTSGLYEFDANTLDVCDKNSTIIEDCESSSNLSLYLGVFIVAQLLHGFGACPLYTLGVTYIDENVPTKMSSVYVGIFYGFSMFGPAIGYVLGGMMLNLYTDIGRRLSITVDSPLWVGAWWLGFIITGTLAWMVSLPLVAYPKQLPGSDKLKRVSETHQSRGEEKASQPGFGSSIRDMPAAFAVLLCNIPFLCLNLAGATEGFIMTGFSTFTPKYVESQFGLPSSWSATLFGIVVVPSGFLGTVMGGWCIKKMKLKVAGIIKYCFVMILFSSLCCAILLARCPNPLFAGITTPYNSTGATIDGNLTDICNRDCHCLSIYDPVCGSDGIAYYSPCHAGCQTRDESQLNKRVYHDCECIPQLDGNSTSAYAGKCERNCSYQIVFFVVFFLAIFFTFMASVPALTATLRCVPFSQRSFALGIQWIVIRVLGSIPGPIVFGAVIDRSCILWEEKCGSSGTCWQYDNPMMSLYLFIVAAGLKVLSLLFFSLALCTYKPPMQETAEDHEGIAIDKYKTVEPKETELEAFTEK